jgi:hypothetical protein
MKTKKKTEAKGRGRKKLDDKIVQTRFGLRKSDWERLTKLKWPNPAGAQIMNIIVRNALIKDGHDLKE